MMEGIEFMSKTRVAVLIALIFGTILSRLIPHPANWTAVGALALWSSVLFRDRFVSAVVPLLVVFTSDLVIGFQETFLRPWSGAMIWVYAAFVLVALLGPVLRPQKNVGRAVFGSVTASLIFFFVSNFGVWFSSGIYAPTSEGLAKCFTLALPFLSNQLAGDLVYTGVFAAVVAAFRLAEAPVAKTV